MGHVALHRIWGAETTLGSACYSLQHQRSQGTGDITHDANASISSMFPPIVPLCLKVQLRTLVVTAHSGQKHCYGAWYSHTRSSVQHGVCALLLRTGNLGGAAAAAARP